MISPISTRRWLRNSPAVIGGKANTIIEGYTGADEDFKILAKEIKTMLGVGGSFKKDRILIQGDYRDRIMTFLKEKGFKVKRVGG